MDHAIKNKGKIYLNSDQELLIYIYVEGKVGKNKVVKAIEIGFTVFDKKNELVIFALTSSTANGISENIIHTTLEVNN